MGEYVGWNQKEQELLRRLLNCFVPEASVEGLSAHIQEAFGSLCYLCETPREVLHAGLQTVPDLPPDVAELLEVLGGIVQQSIFTGVASKPILSAQAAREYVSAKLLAERREVAVFFALDEEFCVVNAYMLSCGIVDETSFSPYGILDVGLRLNAKFVLLAHNHPGGEGKPSFSDVDATKNAIRILGRAGMPLLDHVVVARGTGVSIRESGKIDDSLWTAQGERIPSRKKWLEAE